MSCIYCLNREEFEKSWQDLNVKRLKKGEPEYTKIIEIDVKNLWRLQAQEGLFIESYVDAIFLETFSRFFRIYFPYTGRPNNVPIKSIYPKGKSHLELYVEQFFHTEEENRKIEQVSQELFNRNYAISSSSENYYGEKEIFVNNEFPPDHPSWSEKKIKKWQKEPDENFLKLQHNKIMTIAIKKKEKIPSLAKRIKDQIKLKLKEDKILRDNPLNWKIVTSNNKPLVYDNDSLDGPIRCAEFVSIVWDGMRKLPFSDEQLSSCIGNLIATSFQNHKGEYLFGKTEWIEFTTKNFYARCSVSKKGIHECIRKDFFDFVKPSKIDWMKKRNLGLFDIFMSLTIPCKLFDFDKFVDIFAKEIIPTQVLSNEHNKSFCFSPIQIKIFGES